MTDLPYFLRGAETTLAEGMFDEGQGPFAHCRSKSEIRKALKDTTKGIKKGEKEGLARINQDHARRTAEIERLREPLLRAVKNGNHADLKKHLDAMMDQLK